MKKMLGWIVGGLLLSAQAVSVTGIVDTRTEANARAVAGSVVLGTPSGAIGTRWDSTAYADGWQGVSSEGCSTNLLVLNGCDVRGGRLLRSTTWDSSKMSVLRNSVFVPSKVTLTIGLGAIVKFTPGTAIEVESGGSLVLKGATLADIADDSVGGDTNYDGTSSKSTASDDDFVIWAGTPMIVRVNLWNGGSQVGLTRWYTLGQTYGSLPQLSKEGFRFDGWFTDAKGGLGVPEFAKVSAENLYAHWTAYALRLDPKDADVAAGGRASFSVKANTGWTVSNNGVSWIVLTTTSGTGNGTVSFSVAANTKVTARSATITVSGAGVTRDFTVRQAGWKEVSTPVIMLEGGMAFSGAAQWCSISCATEGATIHYTLNGKDPDESDPIYGGASFNVFESTTIKARAYKDGMAVSAIAVSRIEKKPTLAEALDIQLCPVMNDANAPWTVDENEMHGTKASVRSGKVGTCEGTKLSTTVTGVGTFSFWWKASCADDPKKHDNGDYLACVIDGTEVTRVYGQTDWRQVSVNLGEGTHTVTWLYCKDGKDDEGPAGEDCGWIDAVGWAPKTVTGVNGISESWLQRVGASVGSGDKTAEEIAASDPDGDGMTVEEEYIAGTDPTDPESKFTARIEMVDGEPVVTWVPDLQADEQPRAYKTLGSKDLKTWEDVPEGKGGDYNFFKVSVEMPK